MSEPPRTDFEAARSWRTTLRGIHRREPSLTWSFDVPWWSAAELLRHHKFHVHGRTTRVALVTIREARALHRRFRAAASIEQATALWGVLRVRSPRDWLVLVDVAHGP